jgi:hypothetical protein
MAEFIDEDDLKTFDGWLRYQAIDPITLPPEQLENWRRVYEEAKGLFDYLVSTREQRRRHVEAYCLRSLKVDDKLVFGRRLHRKVGRLLAL